MEWSIGEFRQLADGVYVAVCEPASVNVGLVVGETSALIVDTGATPEQGAALLQAARNTAGVPVTHAVLTHDHWDHWFGLAGMEGLTSIAHENLGAPSGESAQVLSRVGLDEAPQPEVTFSLAKAITLGDVRVEFLHLGGGHTNSDVIVWVPGKNVAFVGDLIESSGDPQFSADSSIRNWPTVLDSMVGAANAETIVVPGHGPAVDRDFVFQQQGEIAMLYGTCEMLIQQGIKVADAAAETEWPFTDETLRVALPLIYAELEAEGITPRTHLPLL